MDRKKFLASGAVGVTGLMLPVTAEAARKHMGPKFDTEQRLHHNGRTLHVRGPFGGKQDALTYVAVVIMQGHSIGHGISDQYGKGDDRWEAVVHADHRGFHPGRAMAHGVQLTPESDEVYTYAWSMPVELVHHH